MEDRAFTWAERKDEDLGSAGQQPAGLRYKSEQVGREPKPLFPPGHPSVEPGGAALSVVLKSAGDAVSHVRI